MKKNLRSLNEELLSLDIGSHSIKWVTGKLDKNMIQLDKACTLPVSAGLYGDGQIHDMQKLRDVLEETLHRNTIRIKSAVCTLESSTIITRELVLPLVKPQELKEIIDYEIQQYLPIELDQYIIQYKLLEEFKKEDVKYGNLLVAALPKSIVENHLALLKSLNLKPLALDIHSNAVSKLLNFCTQINKGENVLGKTAAVIDIGYEQINVNILDNGHFKFNRLLHLGVKDIDTHLITFLDVSQDQAKAIKLEAADITETEMDYSDASGMVNIIRSSTNNWIDEIQRVFKYHTTRSTGNKIDVIYLYGESTYQRGLEKYMEEAFNIPTHRIQSIGSVNTANIKESIDLTNYINALGAMIRR